MILVHNRFSKIIAIAKTWRRARFDQSVQAKAAREARDWLSDARSGTSLVSRGTLGVMSPVRAGWDRETNRGRPVRSWKEHPSRGARQWKPV